MNIYVPEIEYKDYQFILGCFSSKTNAIKAILLYLDNTSLNPLSLEFVNRVQGRLIQESVLEHLEYVSRDNIPVEITASIAVVKFDSFAKCN